MHKDHQGQYFQSTHASAASEHTTASHGDLTATLALRLSPSPLRMAAAPAGFTSQAQ